MRARLLALLALVTGACRGSAREVVEVSPPPPSEPPVATASAPIAPLSPTPNAEPSSIPTAPPREVVEMRAPSAAWKAVEPSSAPAYMSLFFGSGTFEDAGLLRPLGQWRAGEWGLVSSAGGGEGLISIYRRVSVSGVPIEVMSMSRNTPKPKKLPSGAFWYELPSDGVQYYWVTSGSLVIEAQGRLHAGPALATVFRPWALDALKVLSKPHIAP